MPIPHGVTYYPDGSVYYVSNEFDHTLDVVSAETLRVTRQIPLSDRPNNIGITPSGDKVYVAINAGGGDRESEDLNPEIVVVQNFFTELERLVPTN